MCVTPVSCIQLVYILLGISCMTEPATKPRQKARDAVMPIRVRREDRDLIDRAAQMLGKSRSEFVLETARREARTVLADQTTFHLDAKQWKAFVAELDRPVRDLSKLVELLSRKPIWER